MELPLHAKLVHLPIALAVLLPMLTTALWLALARGWLPVRAWTLAVAGNVLLVGSSWLATSSGEADEDLVERVVPEAAIEHHEQAAERFTWAAGGLLLLSFAPLLLHRRPRALAWAAGATVVGSLGVLALGYQVGQAGGELVYRHGAGAAFAVPTAAPAAPAGTHRHGDDDR